MPKKKIAVIHPAMVCGGGSEMFTVWTLQALKDTYDVTLISSGDITFDMLNRCFGSSFTPRDFSIIALPIPPLFKKSFSALRTYKLSRFVKKVAPTFDLMVSTDNVMDFGRPGIQLIMDFTFDDKLRKKYDVAAQESFVHRKSFFRTMYLALGTLLSGTKESGWKQNTTVAVSDWIGEKMKKEYGVDCVTVYPSVSTEFPNVPFENREKSFLVIARLSPEKEIDKVIRILSRVHESFDIKLHIVGRIDNEAYGEYIKGLCKENSSWCSYEGTKFGQEKLQFVSNQQFAISGRTNEPWGIGVAEMVKAGCIVFVPNGGGQTEITNDMRLQYDNEDDAVEKISRVLQDAKLQSELREHLSQQAALFSNNHFQEGIANIVLECLTNAQ
jgi:glycosyltransferase involved in cell wall biosynthesis